MLNLGNLCTRFNSSVYDKCFSPEDILWYSACCGVRGERTSAYLRFATIIVEHGSCTFMLGVVCSQHLLEKVWYAVTETCLAFTVFRDDFSPKFIALFTFLLFLKSFHWLAEDRVDYVSRSDACIRISMCIILAPSISRWKGAQ